jgi:tRNA 2-selenouridine synthase SelU
VQFTVFEMLKKLRSQRLQKEGGQQAVKAGKNMANDLWMGAVAGAVASSMTNPLDVVKTRVMTQTQGGNVVHGGLRSIAKQIWMEEVKTPLFQKLYVANCLCNRFCSPCALCTLCV